MAGLNIEEREWHPMHHVEVVRSHDWQWTLLRPNWFFQNFSTWFAPELETTGRLQLPVADATVSFDRFVQDSLPAWLHPDEASE